MRKADKLTVFIIIAVVSDQNANDECTKTVSSFPPFILGIDHLSYEFAADTK